ncbi:MAG: HEAT repeat domain-containing protein [Desulfuromonadales bacterium]|nr:MAG: HEAT repeat domain-containing protein [Desulfuromonadales bacterium]
MERHRTIDTSLRERRSILTLLERLEQENVSADEMEEIGTTLRTAGGRALSPLFRRLWREKNGDVISRYTYLLDFFEDEGWLDQLIQLTLTRTDLEGDARSALLNALEGYGIDVSSPPFTEPGEGGDGPLRRSLPRLLDRGEKGLVLFMEEFVAYSTEVQKAIVRELAFVDDRRVTDLFGVLLCFDEPETAREVIEALGRVRFPEAATLLRRYLAEAPEAYRSLAERSLRRLAFLGIDREDPPPEPLLPFHAAYASPADASGTSCLFVARLSGDERFDTLFVELHETLGMRDAWGWNGVMPEEYRKIIRENGVEDTLVAVEPSYVAALVADAVERSMAGGFYLPPEFYVRQRIFAGLDIAPAPYVPPFSGFDLATVDTPKRIAQGVELVEDWFFDGWFMFNGQVRCLADALEQLEDDPFARKDPLAVDRFLELWCRGQVAPRLERIVRRLFLTADLMVRADRGERLVEQTLAAAVSLSRGAIPLHRHPFLQRWLLELIDMVRDARAEGYAFPDSDPDDGDEGEWE